VELTMSPRKSKKPPKPKRVKSISLGWARDDDPIYTNAGWNFLMGKNLNSHVKPKITQVEEKPNGA